MNSNRSEEVLNKWKGHLPAFKSNLRNIGLVHNVDLLLLPLNWDFRNKQSKYPFENTKDEILEQCSANSSKSSPKVDTNTLFKTFEGSILHELYLNIPLTPRKIKDTSKDDEKTEYRNTFFGELSLDVIKSNNLQTELIVNGKQVYISPFITQHGDIMFDNWYKYHHYSSIDVITFPEFKSILIEFFMCILCFKKIQVSKFRLSGTSVPSTSKLMNFVLSTSEYISFLLSLVSELHSCNDLFKSIIATELQLFLESLVVLICNPILSSYTYSKISTNPYYLNFKDSISLKDVHSMTCLLKWVYELNYMCYSLKLYIQSLIKLSEIPIQVQFSHLKLLLLDRNIKNKLDKQVHDYILNQVPFECCLFSDHKELMRHHLDLPIYASNIQELLLIVNGNRTERYRKYLECCKINNDSKLALFELMMPNELFPTKESRSNLMIKLRDGNDCSDGSKLETALESEQLNYIKQELAILEWRKKRLTRNHSKSQLSADPCVAVQADASMDEMIVDTSDQCSIMQVDHGNNDESFKPLPLHELKFVQVNGSLNDIQMIRLRDMACVLKDLIDNDLLYNILNLFKSTVITDKKYFVITKHELANIRDAYFAMMLKISRNLKHFTVVDKIKYNSLLSEIHLQIEIGLYPITKICDTTDLLDYARELEWNVTFDKLASKTISNVIKLCFKKIENTIRNACEVPKIKMSKCPEKHTFGSREWFVNWNTFIESNQT